MVAAACKDIEAERGDIAGDSLRGSAVASLLEAIVLYRWTLRLGLCGGQEESSWSLGE